MTPSGIAGIWEGTMDERILGQPISRRGLLKVAGSIGIAGLASPWVSAAKVAASAKASAPRKIPIKHIVVDMQENRSFDHYYGFAPFVGRYGVPAHYSQPDGHGGSVAPYHFTSLSTQDIGHNWTATHGEYDTASDLPFYYSLFKDFTLCTNYFCSLPRPTWPNRFYVAAGTSGGITTNGLWGYGIFDYPIILDLLEAAGVSWKVYNISWDSVPFGNTDNVFVFWKRWAHDQRTRGSKGEYLDDLRLGRLPQVSFIIPSFARGWDEHPPADVSVGMGIQQQLITALMQSSAWGSSAYIVTYDEAGGYFDHVAPPQLDAFGLGIRVPTWVISPFAKPGHLEPTVYEHTSTLKFIEAVYKLHTVASANPLFDLGTPSGGNYQAATGPVGPPAPPRDANPRIGNLMQCFAF